MQFFSKVSMRGYGPEKRDSDSSRLFKYTFWIIINADGTWLFTESHFGRTNHLSSFSLWESSRLRLNEHFASSHRTNESRKQNWTPGFVLSPTSSRSSTGTLHPTPPPKKIHQNVRQNLGWFLHESCPGTVTCTGCPCAWIFLVFIVCDTQLRPLP